MSFKFNWDIEGLSKPRFNAYVALLRLRNGGQIDERSGADEVLSDEDEVAPNNDSPSDKIDKLTLNDYGLLKDAFLDRIAELASNVKGGPYVAATLLLEGPDRFKILVAKNDGFKDNDRKFFKKLEAYLRKLAYISRNDNEMQSKLWNLILEYYDSRLRDWITDFRAAVKQLNDCIAKDKICVGADSQALFDVIMALFNQSELGPRPELLGRAHEIWTSYGVQDFFILTGTREKMANSLRLNIGFLGRLHKCVRTFERACISLENSHLIEITPIELDASAKKSRKAKGRNTQDKWTLAKAMQSLRLPYDEANVQNVVGKKCNKAKLAQDFEYMLSSQAQIHAEVQLLLHLAKEGIESSAVFGYMGCSKLNCLPCKSFVKAYGGFRSRGSHGKLPKAWTLPDVDCKTQAHLEKLVVAVKATESLLVTNICFQGHRNLQMEKESSVGMSVTMYGQEWSADSHTSPLAIQYLHNQRRAAQESMSDNITVHSLDDGLIEEEFLGHNDGPLPITLPESPDHETTPEPDVCDVCERKTDRRCSVCGKGYFCSQSCEDKMSSSHRFKCAQGPLTTADYLEQACRDDRIPDDPLTMEHFGFDRCRNWNEQSHLAGLYQGLVKYLRVSARKLNQWRESGALKENIIELYETVPADSRGSYYPWFLKNQHILDGDSPVEASSGEDLGHQQIMDARPHLSPADRDKAISELQPPEKRDAFLFFAMAKQGAHPHPTLVELYYRFGFCLCHDEYEEMRLGGFWNHFLFGYKSQIDYDRSLGTEFFNRPNIRTPTFEEFWRKYAAGTLVDLMDDYEHHDVHQKPNQLKRFLSLKPSEHDSPRANPWRLYQYLSFEPGGIHQPPEHAVRVARLFGFTNRLDVRRKLALMTFYKKLLRSGDPSVMETRRRNGELLTYATQSLESIDEDVKSCIQELDRAARRLLIKV